MSIALVAEKMRQEGTCYVQVVEKSNGDSEKNIGSMKCDLYARRMKLEDCSSKL